MKAYAYKGTKVLKFNDSLEAREHLSKFGYTFNQPKSKTVAKKSKKAK